MAPPSNFQVDIEKRVAILEDRAAQKNNLLRVTLIGTLITASLGGTGWWVYFVTSSVVAIKQQLKDGGNKELVASLSKPSSPALLKANLTTVIASVQTAQAKGSKADPQKTIPLSLAVDKVVRDQSPPDLAWQAASQLINFRSSSQTQKAPVACKLPVGQSIDTGLRDGLRLDIGLANCTLAIDDPALAEYFYQDTESIREKLDIPKEKIFVHYTLTNVHVIYGGGIILASSIFMQNCTFEIEVNSTPPRSGRTVMESLLEADNIDSVQIPLLDQRPSGS